MSKVVAHKKSRYMTGEIESKQDDFLENRIEQLMFYAKHLRYLSRLLVILLFINFVIVVVLGIGKDKALYSYFEENPYSSKVDLLYLSLFIFFSLSGFLILYLFNNKRKKGMSLYEEITDDIDWSKKRREYIHRPNVKARTSIKDFLHATDLPFTSGVNGQAIYVLGFVLMALAAIILQVKF
jgi:hypothetical protein